MKKIFYILAAAAVVAACSKSEVTDISTLQSEVDTPVNFLPSPITKAGYTEFSKTHVFKSAAYYLKKTKTWQENFAEGVNYIPESEVSYQTAVSPNVWRTVKPYYWPKDGGSLTFYSWSLNKNNLNFPAGSSATVTIDKEKGVLLKNFDITKDTVDFIVAVPAEDRTVNVRTYYTDGVPTLFKHQLSKMKFTAVADEEYPGKTINIKEITITGVASKAEYQEADTDQDGNWVVVDRWTLDPVGDTHDSDVYDAGTGKGTEVTTSTVTFGGDQTIFIPQEFTGNETIIIKYEIVDEVSGITEEITVEIPLKKALESTQGKEDGEFEPGKEYTINFRFTLDLVFWDPAVQDWDDTPIDITE